MKFLPKNIYLRSFVLVAVFSVLAATCRIAPDFLNQMDAKIGERLLLSGDWNGIRKSLETPRPFIRRIPVVNYLLARAYSETDDRDGSERRQKYFCRVIRADPELLYLNQWLDILNNTYQGNPHILHTLAELYYSLYLRSGQKENKYLMSAAEYLDKALSVEPSAENLLSFRSAIAADMGEPKSALKYLNMVKSPSPVTLLKTASHLNSAGFRRDASRDIPIIMRMILPIL